MSERNVSNIGTSYTQKCKKLLESIDQYTKNDVMVAFSGGVGSSLLLKLVCKSAAEHNTRVYAITAKTALHPTNEIALARKMANELGAIHSVISVDELLSAGIENNPKNRCYLCKKCIFTMMMKLAEDLEIDTVLDGTNEDDLQRYGEGYQDICAMGILSPLTEAGFTKTDVRRMAEEYEILVATRASITCLATRFPYGTHLDYEAIQKVEKGEAYIKTLGIYNVRVRVHDKIARIEVDVQDIEKLFMHREDVIGYLKNLGYMYITVDLEGFRSGSMNI